jgi:hypothetical protein
VEGKTVAQFLNLSEACINLDTVRLIYPNLGKAGKDGPRCTVIFLGSGDLHCFYGKDAEALLAYLRENAQGVEERAIVSH